MTKLLFALACTSPLFINGQIVNVKLPSVTDTIVNYSPKSDDSNMVTISMPFGKSVIQKIAGDTAALNRAGNISIDIVCTDYPAKLSLSGLNQRRLNELYNCFPLLAKVHVSNINLFRQKDSGDTTVAKAKFHGLVIHFQPIQDSVTVKHDLEKLDEILQLVDLPKGSEIVLGHKQIDSSIALIDTTEVYYQGGWIMDYDAFRHQDFYKKNHDYDSIQVISKRKAYRQKIITKSDYKEFKSDSLVLLYKKIKKYPASLPMLDSSSSNSFSFTEKQLDSLKKGDGLPRLQDSTVFSVFKRRKWKDAVIVGDVTGSMYKYTAQLLIWSKVMQQDSLSNKFVFFNDGDQTPDDKKKIGKTKGIYGKQCESFEELRKLVSSTMSKGGGGDCPENNVEALIFANQMFPDTDTIVMLADNSAPVKDLKLAHQLHKPVKIVICGVQDNIVNLDYLNLARVTGGSLHTMEQDFYNLLILHEDEAIKIGNRTYKIVNGTFVEVFTM